VSGHLQNELAVPPFVEQLPQWELPNREAAQHERTRAETQALRPLLAVNPNQFDAINLPEPALGDDQLGLGSFQGIEPADSRVPAATRLRYTTVKCIVHRSPRVGAEPSSEPRMSEES
jgi:hypothetical protein